MTETPKIGAHRFEDYSLPEKWAWFQEGRGPNMVTAAQDQLRELAAALDAFGQAFGEAGGQLGDGWTGNAATRAATGMGRAADELGAATAASRTADTSMGAMSESYVFAKNGVPEPAPEPSGLWASATEGIAAVDNATNPLRWFGVSDPMQGDITAARELNRERDHEANRVLYSHHSSSGSAIEAMPAFAAPTPGTLDTGPATGPGASRPVDDPRVDGSAIGADARASGPASTGTHSGGWTGAPTLPGAAPNPAPTAPAGGGVNPGNPGGPGYPGVRPTIPGTGAGTGPGHPGGATPGVPGRPGTGGIGGGRPGVPGGRGPDGAGGRGPGGASRWAPGGGGAGGQGGRGSAGLGAGGATGVAPGGRPAGGPGSPGATGQVGRSAMSGAPMAGSGGRGQGADDGEHRNRYALPEELIVGELPTVVDGVIGDPELDHDTDNPGVAVERPGGQSDTGPRHYR